MRKLITINLLILVLFSCKKEKLISSLPEVTNSGQNSLGFLAEEKVWVPKWTKYSWGENCEELAVQFLLFNKQFELSGGIKINDKKSYFRLYIDSLFTTATYTSNCTISLDDSKGMFIQNGGDYDNVCGPGTLYKITITKLDTTNKIVSGLFQARLRKVLITNLDFQDLYPNSPEYIEIKEGRFDVHYDYCR